MIFRMVLNPEFFFKAVKIHPISKGLAKPTNPSTTEADTTHVFKGFSLCDIIRGLSVETSMGKPPFFPLLSRATKTRH